MDEKPETKPMGQVIQIDEARIRDHLGEMVRGTVEEALNAMLDAEAVPDPRLIDLDHLAHRLRLWLLVHPKLLSAILKGPASPGNVRKTLYVIQGRPRQTHYARCRLQGKIYQDAITWRLLGLFARYRIPFFLGKKDLGTRTQDGAFDGPSKDRMTVFPEDRSRL